MIYYSLKDELTGFKGLFCHTNEPEAIRSFEHAIIKGDIPENYVKDMSLYQIGNFNDQTGEFKPEKKKIIDATALGGRK